MKFVYSDLFMGKLQQDTVNFLVLYNTLKIIDQISNTFFYTKRLTVPVIKRFKCLNNN